MSKSQKLIDALVEAARVAHAELGRAFTHAQDCEDGNPDHIARAMQSLQDALKLAGVELP